MTIDNLNYWIAQSESWQTFIDFGLPKDTIAEYEFLKRPDDFYISLFGSLYDVLDNPETAKEKILSIAKGLEIYSIQNKRDNFSGVNQPNNILFSAGLYYLADYTSSASILANIFTFNEYKNDIEKFLLSFLNRKLLKENFYRILFDKFLKTGNQDNYEELLERVLKRKEYYFKYDPYLFSVYYLAESILSKFQKDNIWVELLKQNDDISYWNEYIEKSITKEFPIWDFFPSQKLALEKGILKEYKSIALQTPTSSGKTAISELLIYNEVKNNPWSKILFLAPFRALASELKQSFGKNLADLGISSKTIYGGDIPTAAEKKAIQDVDLLISTPEKFMAIENIDPNFSLNFTIVICDEGHLLGEEGNRGLSYELLLSRLKKEDNKKFVFLSAIIPNIKEINQWLGGNDKFVIKSNYRPTEIEYAFLEPLGSSNKNFQLVVHPLSEFPKKYILNKFLTIEDLTYQEQLKTKIAPRIDNNWKSKSAIIALKALNFGSVALFAPTKGKLGVNGLVKEIISQIDKKPVLFSHLELKRVSQDKKDLKEYFEVIFGEEYLLTKVISYNFLFHHGDLPQYVREIVEDYIRQEKIKLVVCTNTLAEGVNLPIRTLVLHTTRRDNRENITDIDLRNLKNLFGRAGRAGKETKGFIIVPNPRDFLVVEKIIKDEGIQNLKGYLYRIIKSITDRKLELTEEFLDNIRDSDKELIDVIDKAIIDLLEETIDARDIDNEIQNLIKNTFAYYQANDEEKETLNTLIQLRGSKIKPYIENSNFPFIKKSGSNIRLYEEVEEKLDIENNIWTDVKDPINDEWLEFMLKIVFDLSFIKYQLEEFNQKNFKEKKNSYLKYEDIKEIIILWIQGNWFETISGLCSYDIDISLRLINHFIGYNLQSAIISIIHIVELKLEGKELSSTILDFPQYLQYGLQNRTELDLIEIGFTDRIGIIELSKILKEKNIKYSDLSELKTYLNKNNKEIIGTIKDKLPKISLEKVKKALSFFKYKNIK